MNRMRIEAGGIAKLPVRVSLLASAALLLAGQAHAQEGVSATPASEFDEIVVTGTLIRGIAPVGAPVTSVDAESILKSGYTDVTSVLRSIPQVSTLGISGSTTGTTANGQGTNTTFASGVNIHGLGAQATLTLIDGHRGAPGGQFGNYFDPGNVPVIAIGRIDVLTDGASAIYGSDAMAGVVNLGLRRNFDGLEARASVSFADDYVTNSQSVIVGRNWSSGSVMLAAEHSYSPVLLASDRPDLYIADGPSVFMGNGSIPRGYSPFTVNPNILGGGGVMYAGPSGATDLSDFTPNAQNIQGAWYNSSIMPEFERTSVIGSFNQNLTDNLEIYATGLYSNRKFYGFGHTSGSTVAAESTLTVPSSNPYFISGVPGGADSIRVRLSQLANIGPSSTDGTEQSWLGVVGARLTLANDWQIDVFGQRAGNRVNRNIYNNVNTCGIQGGVNCLDGGALADANPATAFNPFGPNPSSVIDRFASFRESNSYYDSTIVGAKIDGGLFELPGGAVMAAIGGEWRHDNQGQQLVDSRSTPGPKTYSIIESSKSMDVWSAFAEVVVPIFGDSNSIGGFRQLDLSAAVRYSDYNILSSASTNPKFGITWRPIEDLSISSTFAKSFRVNLASTDKNNQPLNRVRTIPDYFSGTGFSNMLQLGGGNPLLQPENAETFTVGVDWKPTGLPGLRVYASYFDIKYAGVIDTPGVPILNSVTQAAEAIYGDYLIRRPSTLSPGASDSAFDALVASFVNDPTFSGGGTIDSVQVIGDGRSQNAGVIKADGLDFAISYDWDVGIGKMNAGINGEIFFSYNRSLTPSGVLTPRKGLIDYPNDYSLRGNIGWSNDNFAIDLFGNYNPSYTNTYRTPYETVDSYFTLDATVSYTTSDNAGLLGGLRLAASVHNLLDADPPYAAVFEQNFDSSAASMLGRVITLSVAKIF